MRRIRAQTSFIVLMVLSVSILGPMLKDDEHPPQVGLASIGVGWTSIYRSPFGLVSGPLGPSALLNSSNRLSIYNYVLNKPGVHFRGICSGLGFREGTGKGGHHRIYYPLMDAVGFL